MSRPDLVRPNRVGSFEQDRSLFGVYDLAGNVSEWVQDYFSKYGGRPEEKFKVYRGGNFTVEPAQSAATYRWYDYPSPPSDAAQKQEYEKKVFSIVGFRCAKDATP